MNEQICRLCLQTTKENCQILGEPLKSTIQLNLEISKEAVICMECANNLEVLFKFKSSACVYKGDQSVSTMLKDMDLDQEQVENTSNLVALVETKSEIRCSFCIQTFGREDLTSLSESKEHVFLVDVLREHIPKLNLNITEELLTCETCLDRLQIVSSFVMRCSDVEQKISKYTEIKGTDKGQIDLKEVQQFIFKSTIKVETESSSINELTERLGQLQEGNTLQAEMEIKCEKGIELPELIIKTEGVDIKPEQSNCDSFQEPSTLIKVDNGQELTFKNCAEITKCGAKRKDHLKKHNVLHESPSTLKMFQCDQCPYETKRRGDLTKHKLIHKNTLELKMFKCELCPFETIHRRYLPQHKLVHKSTSELKMFKCEQCPYETKRRGDLTKHKLIHKNTLELKMFKCELCPFETIHRRYLPQHKLVHKSTSELKIFQCEQCPYVSKRRFDLTKHKCIHKNTSELKMFKCELCPFETIHRSYLLQHKLVHKSTSELKMFKCEQCPYETKRRGDLTKHKLTHRNISELKMFKCALCLYETKRQSDLKQHEVIHKSASELKMFKCALCLYETKRRSDLKQHEVIHKSASELKMFKCELCPFKTKYRGTLRRHKLIHKS